jgi:hypothetical protein
MINLRMPINAVLSVQTYEFFRTSANWLEALGRRLTLWVENGIFASL